MNTIRERAAQARRLREDEALQGFIAEVRNAQASVFLNPASSQEDREEAHGMIRAISKIEGVLKTAEADWAFEQKKGQHRGSD